MTEIRKLIQLIENATTTYYHITPTRNLRNIMINGLIPKRGVRSRKLCEPEPAIYLFPSLDDVQDAINGWLGNEFSDDARLALLAVSIPANANVQSGVEYERTVNVPIAAENIRVLSRDVLGEISVAHLD